MNSDGDGGVQFDTTTYTNSGGSNGSNRASGKRGENGKAGHDGQDGSYKIIVPKVGTYKERYDVRIKSYKTISSNDKIIEPREHLGIEYIALENPTSMPAPSNIHIFLEDNTWIAFDKKIR